jgi:hypothetical protein
MAAIFAAGALFCGLNLQFLLLERTLSFGRLFGDL